MDKVVNGMRKEEKTESRARGCRRCIVIALHRMHWSQQIRLHNTIVCWRKVNTIRERKQRPHENGEDENRIGPFFLLLSIAVALGCQTVCERSRDEIFESRLVCRLRFVSSSAHRKTIFFQRMSGRHCHERECAMCHMVSFSTERVCCVHYSSLCRVSTPHTSFDTIIRSRSLEFYLLLRWCLSQQEENYCWVNVRDMHHNRAIQWLTTWTSKEVGKWCGVGMT